MVIRLDKYLCDMQAGTRSAVKDIIRKKRVTINGEVITRPEIKVDIDKDVITNVRIYFRLEDWIRIQKDFLS